MFDILNTSDMNWLAIIVATVVAMVLGALWYSPMLFMKQWSAASGRTAEDMTGGGVGYLISAVSWLVAAIVTSIMFDTIGVTNVGEGLLVAALFWLAFGAGITFVNNSFQGRPRSLAAIDTGYQLVGLLAIGAIIAAWQ